jgi:uroporphyrinogen decarboxylase
MHSGRHDPHQPNRPVGAWHQPVGPVPLTPRERVLTAIAHEEPDRVPIVIGVSNATGIKMAPYRELKQLIGVTAPDDYLYDWPELGTAAIDEETMRRLHSDVRGVLDLEPGWVLQRNREREPHSDYVNSWGSGAKEIKPGEWFPMVEPLAAATEVAEIDEYPWPDMDDPSRVAHVAEQAARLAEGQYAVIATPWLLFPLERAFAMQGMETFLMNMALHPDFAEELLLKIAELCKRLMIHFLDALAGNADIIKIGDDLGTQQSLLMSPDMYRRVLKPIHAEFIQLIKDHTSAKVLFHSCGDIYPLLDDLVEIGIDILNPVQTSAGQLSDLQRLKSRYGKKLTFCGAIDTHRVLNQGTPEEVRAEVDRVIQTLGPGGGYLAGAVHTIMNDVPAHNILAMVDAIEELGRYPLKGSV